MLQSNFARWMRPISSGKQPAFVKFPLTGPPTTEHFLLRQRNGDEPRTPSLHGPYATDRARGAKALRWRLFCTYPLNAAEPTQTGWVRKLVGAPKSIWSNRVSSTLCGVARLNFAFKEVKRTRRRGPRLESRRQHSRDSGFILPIRIKIGVSPGSKPEVNARGRAPAAIHK